MPDRRLIPRPGPDRRRKKTFDPRAIGGPTVLTDDLRAAIARRAFELYEQRGRADGHDLDDWLQAEREVFASAHPAGST